MAAAPYIALERIMHEVRHGPLSPCEITYLANFGLRNRYEFRGLTRHRSLLAHAIAEEWAQNAQRKYGWTWFYGIQAGTDGPVKLGNAKNPAERLMTLQTANVAVLVPIAAWPILAWEERQIHEFFGPERIRGEWFEPTRQLVAFLRSNGEWHWEDAWGREFPGAELEVEDFCPWLD